VAAEGDTAALHFFIPKRNRLANFFDKQHASRLGTARSINYTGNQSAQKTNPFGANTQQLRCPDLRQSV
jgi:hypothetical protein